jgi:hypothetical protein
MQKLVNKKREGCVQKTFYGVTENMLIVFKREKVKLTK